jgi:glycerol-3-phosphate acyltransferase PlsY
VSPFVLLLGAYLLGAVPTSYLVGKLRGIDLRKHGSGNLGATNTYRVLGWRAAAPVFIFDIFKGWLPAFYFPRIDGEARAEWALAYGAAAILGHVFSIYVRFKGGKGVATSAGVLLALAPVAVGISMLLWAAIVFLTGYVSLASILTASIMPVLVYFMNGPGAVLWLTLGLACFVVYAHRANIGRLRRGEEHSFRKKKVHASPGEP